MKNNIDMILKKVDLNRQLTKEDAVELLGIDNKSSDFYKLISKANEKSRVKYNNKGYIFSQIGINANPCTGNCKFCSLGKDNYSITQQLEMTKSKEEILALVSEMDFKRVTALFLMTTADFSFEKYLDIAKAVKDKLPANVKLVANIGDFLEDKAIELKEVGFSAVYHIVRLREGIDTDLSTDKRLETLNAIKNVGLELFYCIEPIGAEHSYEEIADEMLRAREYAVDVMAVMARISVKGTKFEAIPELGELEITKIAAVTRLVTDPKQSMNVHEPKKMTLLAGINQLYAEIGVNPRDVALDTQKNRGFGVQEIIKLLEDAEYIV